MTDTVLEFACPVTGQMIDTGVKTTAAGLADNWNKTLHVTCLHCGREHIVVVRDAFTAEVLSDRSRGRL